MAGDEVSVANQIAAADRLIAKAQVALGDAAGLFAVVLEVGLYIFVGMVTDNLDGVLVGADRTVRAETPELATAGTGRYDVDFLADGQGAMGYVVVDADGVMVGRLGGGHVLVHSHDLGGGGVLAGQAEAAGVDGQVAAELLQHAADILVQGLAGSAGLLGAVENRDGLDGGGQGVQQILHGERAVQVDIQVADLLALRAQIVDGLRGGFSHAAHADEDVLGLGVAVVVDAVIFAAGQLAHLAHVLLHDFRQSIVVGIHGLAALEVSVGVQTGGAQQRTLGVQAALAEFLEFAIVDELCQVPKVQNINFLNFVGGAEAVEEMQEGNMALDSGQVGDSADVHALLHIGGSQQRKTGLAAGHDVGVLRKDGDIIGSHVAGGGVDDGGLQLARDSVHGGDHQHHALAGRVAGAEAAAVQCAVHGGDRTSLALHLDQLDRLTEDVLHSAGSPGVNVVGHRAGRGDGIDGCNFGKRIRSVCGCLVTVHSFHFSHKDSVLSVFALFLRFCLDYPYLAVSIYLLAV